MYHPKTSDDQPDRRATLFEGLPLKARLKRSLVLRLRRHFVVKHFTSRTFIKHKAVFVHIPKAAGISVCESLFGNRGGGHLTYRLYHELFTEVYGIRDFDDYFVFAIVRNPWDRLHSAYEFLSRGGISPEDREFRDRELSKVESFRSFVMDWLTPERIPTQIHLFEQHEFIIDRNGKNAMNLLGRFEHLAEDYERIRERAGIGQPLVAKNKTGGRTDYRTAYDDAMRERVAQLYPRDCTELGYTFDGLTEPAQAGAA